MTRYLTHTALLFAVGLLLFAPDARAQDQESLDGVWKTVEVWGTTTDGEEWRWEDPQPGITIFMDGYWSRVAVLGTEPRPELSEDQSLANMEGMEDLSKEELGAMIARLQAVAGTYTVSGSTITFSPMVAKSPRSTYEGWQQEFEMKDGELHYSGTYSVNGGGTWQSRAMRLN